MPSFKRDSSVYISNNQNLEYTGAILLGEDMQPLEVVWDTGSSWLVVEGSDCTNCTPPVYMYENNPETFSNNGGDY
jgi:hypothetical protein